MNVFIDNLNITKDVNIEFDDCRIKFLELFIVRQSICYYYQNNIYFPDQLRIKNLYWIQDSLHMWIITCLIIFILCSCLLLLSKYLNKFK